MVSAEEARELTRKPSLFSTWEDFCREVKKDVDQELEAEIRLAASVGKPFISLNKVAYPFVDQFRERYGYEWADNLFDTIESIQKRVYELVDTDSLRELGYAVYTGVSSADWFLTWRLECKEAEHD